MFDWMLVAHRHVVLTRPSRERRLVPDPEHRTPSRGWNTGWYRLLRDFA
jgi:hypothetical protein